MSGSSSKYASAWIIASLAENSLAVALTHVLGDVHEERHARAEELPDLRLDPLLGALDPVVGVLDVLELSGEQGDLGELLAHPLAVPDLRGLAEHHGEHPAHDLLLDVVEGLKLRAERGAIGDRHGTQSLATPGPGRDPIPGARAQRTGGSSSWIRRRRGRA